MATQRSEGGASGSISGVANSAASGSSAAGAASPTASAAAAPAPAEAAATGQYAETSCAAEKKAAPGTGPLRDASNSAPRQAKVIGKAEVMGRVAETLRRDAEEAKRAEKKKMPCSSSSSSNSCAIAATAIGADPPQPILSPLLKTVGCSSTSSSSSSPSAFALTAMVSLAEKRNRAVAAMDEMRKRAARYRETPKALDDLSSQMEGLEVDDEMAIYNKVYESHPVAIGKAISKMERDETNRSGDSTLVYGEITFKTLALALHKVKTKYGLPGVGSSGDTGVMQKAGGAFYDIGAGTGKPVIAAAILHHFDKAVGIEILEGLHSTSMELLKTWEGGLRDRVGHQPPTNVEFLLGDALDMNVCDWSDGDVVFANSTCFDDALMRKLASAATALKKGAIFITLTKRLPAAYFKVLENDMFPMSWGSATVYMSQKTTDPFGDPNAVDEGSAKASKAKTEPSDQRRGSQYGGRAAAAAAGGGEEFENTE